MEAALLDYVVLPDGSKRRLGNIVPPFGVMKRAYPVYGEGADERLIPRSEWKSIIADFPPPFTYMFLPPLHDQDGAGQCNADAVTTAAECKRMQQGLPYIKLSAPDLYDRINGGRDQGSLLEDGMDESSKNGLAALNDAGGNEVWKRGQRLATAEQRLRYRVLEWRRCPTFDHFYSGLLRGDPGVSGVMWRDSDTPDSNGYLPDRPRGNAGGHATFAFYPSLRNDGMFGAVNRQSWGPGWSPNTNNCFIIPEVRYTSDIGGLWILKSMTDEGV